MREPIRVFVGCAANGEDAESCAALEWSIRKRASRPVEIVWMAQSRDSASLWAGWNTGQWATPFSGFRWAIPEACGFQGRAIYTDSDVLFLADVAELFEQPIAAGKIVLGKKDSWRLCVCLWDCAAARDVMIPLANLKRLPDGHKIQAAAVRPFVDAFGGEWNCLDGAGFSDLAHPRLKALHYTDMSSQPHLPRALARLKASGQSHWFDGPVRPHPRRDVQALFDHLLAEAEANGFKVENYVPREPFGPYRKKSLIGYRGAA